jgi:uncharacterized membrane protein YraQ (UPF0718 family)
MIDAILRALSMAFAMGWEILWPLILGFALSAVVQAVVSHREMARLLPHDRPRSIATALALGAASSSSALERSLSEFWITLTTDLLDNLNWRDFAAFW